MQDNLIEDDYEKGVGELGSSKELIDRWGISISVPYFHHLDAKFLPNSPEEGQQYIIAVGNQVDPPISHSEQVDSSSNKATP